MTTQRPTADQCPAHASAPPRPDRPLPIFGPAFSTDPDATYALLRAQGPIAPVEIAPNVWGYLTTTYAAALHLLRNTPGRFAKDPRHWHALANGHVPADSPALLMMMPRNNALWMDGREHARLRRAITGSLARVDTHALAASVTRIADELIDEFAHAGFSDLVGQYADQLPMKTMIQMFGCPPEIGLRIVVSVTRLFDTDQDGAAANAELEAACLALTRLKRHHPGADVASWLIDAGLDDEEMVQTTLLVIGAATTPSSNLIMNGMHQVLTDARFSANVHAGVQPISEALDEVLWTKPPVANYSPLYPIGHQEFEGVVLQSGYPILVSFAAANGDPALAIAPEARAGNRGHLAFSAGVHGCPAPDLARIIAETAIERVLDRLPHLALATTEPLHNRPGTFHTGLTHLPVRFQPTSLAPTGR